MAARSGLSESTIGRIWKAFELKPHRANWSRLSDDPLFVAKVFDVVGLYSEPAGRCGRAMCRREVAGKRWPTLPPAFPMMPGIPETHPRLRATAAAPLFAAFNTANGQVICTLRRRTRIE